MGTEQKRMSALEKVLMILANYIGACFTIGLGNPMLPIYPQPVWFGFNAYMWIVAPILVVIADRKEGKKR